MESGKTKAAIILYNILYVCTIIRVRVQVLRGNRGRVEANISTRT